MSTGSFQIKEYHHPHHFKDGDHEYDSSKQGLWLFLVSEILMFGSVFFGYFYYHSVYTEAFTVGAEQMKLMWGAINTVVLIFSSFTVAQAITAVQMNNLKQAAMMLWITIGCGFAFLGIKYIEYSSKISHGLLPGRWLDPHEASLQGIDQLGMYFGFYYSMTGLHGIHVVVGMIALAWALRKVYKGEVHAKNFLAVEGAGLFWHLVDLIWIFLFPVLYIVG
jgi:cytochrome c oxidase subunit 3